MPDLIRCYDNKNQPIVDNSSDVLSLTYFIILRLSKGQTHRQQLRQFETVYVVLSGRCAHTYETFRILPEAVDMVEVGSVDTNSRRCIYNILGKNADGRAGNLLVSELYADKGCGSGYPPHKHDEERGDDESAFEEIYHYRFRPDAGFGAQIAFQPDGSSCAFMTHTGDTILLDRTYHPTVTSPGHDGYIFTIIVGKQRRSLIQYFSDEHHYLMDQIPGLRDMVDKFK